jgi:hypothetical protein
MTSAGPAPVPNVEIRGVGGRAAGGTPRLPHSFAFGRGHTDDMGSQARKSLLSTFRLTINRSLDNRARCPETYR